jgi:putative nucleotidyltransferase with HDIG domain
MVSIISNANAMLWLSKIKNEDKYTSEHCMRVGVLSIAFGRFLGFPEPDLELIGLAGMLHDVGKIKTPPEILNKPGKLTPEEYEIMKQHSVLGKNILEEMDGIEQLIVDTAHLHHERVDGKGYPEKLDATMLHKFIRMISVVDVYDAITSDRCYQRGKSAFEALKILFGETDKHFDKKLVEAFIRMIGIYPPGTLVEMTNGEVGIVISSNPNARLKPKVELVADAEKKLRAPYVVDLATNPNDSNGLSYVIKTGLPNKTYGIDIKEYLFRD